MSSKRKFENAVLAHLTGIHEQLTRIACVLEKKVPPVSPPAVLTGLVNYSSDSDDEPPEPPLKRRRLDIPPRETKVAAAEDAPMPSEDALPALSSDGCNSTNADSINNADSVNADSDNESRMNERIVDYFEKKGVIKARRRVVFGDTDSESDDDYTPSIAEDDLYQEDEKDLQLATATERPYATSKISDGRPHFISYSTGISRILMKHEATSHLKRRTLPGGEPTYSDETTGNLIVVKIVGGIKPEMKKNIAGFLKIGALLKRLHCCKLTFTRLIVILFVLNGTNDQNTTALGLLSHRISVFSSFGELANKFTLYTMHAVGGREFVPYDDENLQKHANDALDNFALEYQAK